MLHGFGTINNSSATSTAKDGAKLSDELTIDGKEPTDLATKVPSEKRRRPRRRVKNAVHQAAAKEAANEGLSLQINAALSNEETKRQDKPIVPD
jgi:hypothetical protein